MIDSKVLVTGGSGMVGSALKILLPDAQYPSSSELNLLCQSSIDRYFEVNEVKVVLHLAAHVGSLHDNIENRIQYFDNNIIMNTLLTKAAFHAGVTRFIGILSTCIYPDKVSEYPMSESILHEGAPHHDLFSYAYAKRAHAVQINSYRETHNIDYSFLIPCNMYGVPGSGHDDRLHFVNDLVKKIVVAKRENQRSITLFGDGSPLRQFMLADDFARFVYDYLKSGCTSSMNVAPPSNYSIHEMAEIALDEFGLDFSIVYDSSKPNGQIRKDVSTDLLKREFSQFEFTDFRLGLKRLYEYYKSIL